MNERTLELAKQAGLKVESFMTNPPKPFQILGSTEQFEKFAELMVKKFDDILVLEYLDCVGNKDKQAAERVQRLQEKVKTYFGVEE